MNRVKRAVMSIVIMLIVLVVSTNCFAEESAINSETTLVINTIWVLVASFLVFLMQAGFAMLETGLTRAKNAGNIMMKNIMDFVIGSMVFFILGIGFMFGKDIGGLIGFSGFFGADTGDHGVTNSTFILFQTMFAGATATILSGSMAERTKFSTYLVVSAIMSVFIYPVVGHWIWGGGWLTQMGMIDFAGSTVVHSVGGWASLVGAAMIGPRIGKYDSKGNPVAIPGHNITYAAIGGLILWFGWFGFNPGSTLSGVNLAIADICVTTNLAGAAGGAAAVMVTWIRYKKPDVSMTINGFLAGLVGITAGCAAVNPLGAMIIGFITGCCVVFGVEFFEKVLKIDDPVGAISVHGLSGAIGTILVGVFAVEGGLLYGGGFKQLGIQLLGVVSTFGWVVITAFIMFSILKATMGLRVSKEEEIQGLDVCEHGSEAYPDFAYKPTSETDVYINV